MSIVITKQPESVVVSSADELAVVTIEATGDDLNYTWYYCNPNGGNTTFNKSTTTGNTYSITVTTARDGFLVYCVVTDANGSSVKSETVTLSIRKYIVITEQPKDVSVKNGDTFYITVEASGEGLVYEWYYHNPNMGTEGFSKSSTAQGSTYSNTMKLDRNGFQVYCIITDADGNSVQTRTSTAKCLIVSTKIQKHDLDVTPEDLGAMSRSGILKATLLASGWTEEVPYTQVLTVEGVKDGDRPIISCGEPETLSADSYKALDKNYGMINKAVVSANNEITFYCYAKKPTVDIPLFIKV